MNDSPVGCQSRDLTEPAGETVARSAGGVVLAKRARRGDYQSPAARVGTSIARPRIDAVGFKETDNPSVSGAVNVALDSSPYTGEPTGD